jgi:excisionase family DNA binding protein
MKKSPHSENSTARFFTIAQVSEILELCKRSVRRLIDHKKLTAHKFGRAVRIAESDLNAFIARHRRI